VKAGTTKKRKITKKVKNPDANPNL